MLEVNAVPVFADIESETYWLDPASFRLAITTPRTRAVISVHFGEQSAELDSIRAIAAEHGLAVIEDAAYAHGAEYKGQLLGSIGQIGFFSFQASKNSINWGGWHHPVLG